MSSAHGRSPRPSTRPATGRCGCPADHAGDHAGAAHPRLIRASAWRGARSASLARAYAVRASFALRARPAFRSVSRWRARSSLRILSARSARWRLARPDRARASTSTDARHPPARTAALERAPPFRLSASRVLGAVHFFMQSKLDIYQPALMAGFLIWLLAYRMLYRRNGERDPAPPGAAGRRRRRCHRGRRSADLSVHAAASTPGSSCSPISISTWRCGRPGGCLPPASRSPLSAAGGRSPRVSGQTRAPRSHPAPCPARPRSNPAADGGTR